MQATVKTKNKILYVSLMAIFASPVTSWSESELVFKDIVEDVNTGISYERVPSPAFENLKALRQELLVFNPLDPTTFENIAQFKPLSRGLPGIAIFNSDNDMNINFT